MTHTAETFYFDFHFLAQIIIYAFAAVGSAGFSSLFYFSLGIQHGETVKGRIFSFLGRIWPLKCVMCWNFWQSAAVFAGVWVFFGHSELAFLAFPMFAGFSHIILKTSESMY